MADSKYIVKNFDSFYHDEYFKYLVGTPACFYCNSRGSLICGA